MNDHAANFETSKCPLPSMEELLVLDEGTGECLHVRPAALAEFGDAIDASLETLEARWAPYASPRAKARAAAWRR